MEPPPTVTKVPDPKDIARERILQKIEEARNLLIPLVAQNVPESSIEVESRFGNFYPTGFVSGVSRRTFIRIRDLATGINPKYIYSHSKDTIYRDRDSPGWPYDRDTKERYTVEYNAAGTPIDTYRMVKTLVRNFDVSDYFLRISISKEIKDKVEPPKEKPMTTREKKRWSFELPPNQNKFRLDITEVTTSSVPAPGRPPVSETVYEVELEVLSPKLDNINGLEKMIILILIEMQGSLILYTSQEKADIITRTNGYIGSRTISSQTLDFDAIIQPRDLKIKDLVMGGIIPKTNRDVSYTVTIKADGERKLLVIDSLGLYLMYGEEVNKIGSAKITEKLQTWHGTVFECEYIPKANIPPEAEERYKRAILYVLMYDTLSIGGNAEVRNLSLFQRQEYIEKFLILVRDLTRYIFEKKRFERFAKVEDFYRMSKTVYLKSYPFYTDGLIYTPDNYRYDTSVNRMKLYQRKLEKQPDILKWKPPAKLTIDFAIFHVVTAEGNYIDLLMSEYKVYKRFIGTDEHPFDPRVNVLLIPQLQAAPNYSVFEFKWVNNRFEMVKPRDNKPYPNRVEVALDIWEDIHKPIDEGTIQGTKFSLVFRYHNREKRELYNALKNGLPSNTPTRTILEVGLGKFGDLWKIVDAGFTHVIGVEPNEKNRTEAKGRIDELNNIRQRKGLPLIKYLIIPTIGQDYQTIIQQVRQFAPGGQVDAISYMLSLSFFFRTPESVHSILYLVGELLRPGGFFIALTIDGRYVLELFNDTRYYTETNGIRRANLELITMELRPANNEVRVPHVFINIPGSIVTDQIEDLTNIPELQSLLQNAGVGGRPIGMSLISEWRTDRELFLLPEELIFSRLFTAFIMKRK